MKGSRLAVAPEPSRRLSEGLQRITPRPRPHLADVLSPLLAGTVLGARHGNEPTAALTLKNSNFPSRLLELDLTFADLPQTGGQARGGGLSP